MSEEHKPSAYYAFEKPSGLGVDRFGLKQEGAVHVDTDASGNDRYWYCDLGRILTTKEFGDQTNLENEINNYIEQFLGLPAGSVTKKQWERVRQKRFAPKLPEGLVDYFTSFSRHPYFVMNAEGTRAIVFFYVQGADNGAYKVFTVNSTIKPPEVILEELIGREEYRKTKGKTDVVSIDK